jgi:hypothetical protein
MTTKIAAVSRLAFASLALAFACSDDPGPSEPGRGTPACNEWQAAYCNLIARCQGAASVCDQVKGVTCKSDAEAKRCAGELASASCAAPPTTCNIIDIADPAPAKKGCESFEDAFCKRIDECQPGAKATCLNDVKTTLDCSKAIGITLAFDSCMASVPKIACVSPALPDVCKGVLLLSP